MGECRCVAGTPWHLSAGFRSCALAAMSLEVNHEGSRVQFVLHGSCSSSVRLETSWQQKGVANCAGVGLCGIRFMSILVDIVSSCRCTSTNTIEHNSIFFSVYITYAVIIFIMHTGFWWGNLREGDHLEDKVGWGMDWIDVAQDRDRWRAVVNAIMNLRVT